MGNEAAAECSAQNIKHCLPGDASALEKPDRSAGSAPGQRLRRWPGAEPALCQDPVEMCDVLYGLGQGQGVRGVPHDDSTAQPGSHLSPATLPYCLSGSCRPDRMAAGDSRLSERAPQKKHPYKNISLSKIISRYFFNINFTNFAFSAGSFTFLS